MNSLTEVSDRLGKNITNIKNRGLAVSTFLFIWSELIKNKRQNEISAFGKFLDELLGELKKQVAKAKQMEIDPAYKELLNFQMSLTQGTGDAVSFQIRQAFLLIIMIITPKRKL